MRVRDIALGSSATAVAVGAVALLWMVRTEASRTPGSGDEEPLALTVPNAAATRGDAPPEGARKGGPLPREPRRKDDRERTPPGSSQRRDLATAGQPAAPTPALVPPQTPTLKSPIVPGLVSAPFQGEGGEEDPDRDRALEQRKLASLERRAQAIVRRMVSMEAGGGLTEEQIGRDRERLERLREQIKSRRADLGLPPTEVE